MSLYICHKKDTVHDVKLDDDDDDDNDGDDDDNCMYKVEMTKRRWERAPVKSESAKL